MDVNPQEFGELKGQVEALASQVEALGKAVNSLTAAYNQQVGAVKLAVWLSAGVAGIAGYLASHFTFVK